MNNEFTRRELRLQLLAADLADRMTPN